MKISVVGLGYVGAVCSACFANEGHDVIGVDIDKKKIELINSGISPIVEKDLESYIKKGIETKKLQATDDLDYAVRNSDVTIIAVGTPSLSNGSLNLDYIKEAAKSVGELLKTKESFHVVSMRSTVLPRTARDVVVPIIEDISGKKLGKDFGYVSNPEFLRESTAIYDFYHPPFTIIGGSDEKSLAIFEELYSFLDAPLFKSEIEVAEMIKYSSNAWHALKVTFANEIGMICKKFGIDSHKVMDIFCADTKLNISSYYMKPGFAFGGSCLPKDVKALTHKAKELDVEVPVLQHIMFSNELQVRRIFKEFIQPLRLKKVAILGLSFKAGTDDLREAPQLTLAEMLIGKGYELKIYDANVMYAKEIGAIAQMLSNELHHIDKRLSNDLEQTIENADILIIGNSASEFNELQKRYPNKHIIDLVRITKETSDKNYEGICW